MTNEEIEMLDVEKDRMRFIKNKASANLALLGIVFDVFYFVNIYRSDAGSFYYTILIGASIVYNLLFLLGTFLASEGVKNYKKGYSYLLMVLGIGQIIRIFILPRMAHAATVTIGETSTIVMGNSQYTKVIAYLVLSAACLIVSGVISVKRCTTLENYLKTLENGKAA
ncbi:MAG: hypothetical protein Q4E57_01580 [Eubacteriales bacterium]|nr:hypothetical protein [Eubacteriales bacterium]